MKAKGFLFYTNISYFKKAQIWSNKFPIFEDRFLVR